MRTMAYVLFLLGIAASNPHELLCGVLESFQVLLALLA